MYKNKIKIALTIDFEDYNYNFSRDYISDNPEFNEEELKKQYWILRESFDALGANATFFIVSKMIKLIGNNIINDIKNNYHIGCHSYQHLNLSRLSEKEFDLDTDRAKKILEDTFQKEILYYRAPYFSAEKITNFFYKILSKHSFQYSSSIRLSNTDKSIITNEYNIHEIPLKSFGIGSKKYTIIGGTYFRITPLNLIIKLLKNAAKNNFIPMVYLHNYDFDPFAKKLKFINLKGKINNEIRYYGRKSVFDKLKGISNEFEFTSLDDFVNE